ncbi:MAG: HYR domain-containing protein [Myxococcales bacterium]|nr:HYR domain-containing protein [Myxococcales bacterium]
MPSGLFAVLPFLVLAQAPAPTRVADLLVSTRSPRGSSAGEVASLSGQAFVVLSEPSTGEELWATDGTPSGTRLVIDLCPGVAGSGPTLLTVVGSALYFMAGDSPLRGHRKLWRTDGTAAGTTPVANLACEALVPVGTELFCLNRTGVWKTDGTAAGTTAVHSFGTTVPNTQDITNAVALNGMVLFAGRDRRLWRTDGTSAGTVSVLPSRPAVLRSPLVVVGNTVFYVATDLTSGLELWSSDGTAAGTGVVSEIGPGGASGIYAPFTTSEVVLVAAGTRLFFFAQQAVTAGGSATTGIELFTSDGSEAGTVLVADLSPGTSSTFSSTSTLVAHGNRVYFSGPGGEPWSSDGLAAGTSLLRDLTPGANNASSPRNFLSVGARLYFDAAQGTTGRNWWVTDGTGAGTVALLTGDRRPSRMVGAVGSRALWLVDDSTQTGIEPWVSDGTVAGTVLLRDVSPGRTSGASAPRAFAQLGTALLLVGDDGAGRENLFRTDGTAAGTTLLRGGFHDIARIVSSSTRAWFVSTGQLWTTDGTGAGTVMLSASGADHLTVQGGRLWFSRASTTWEPFVSDGTIPGTRQLTGLIPNATGLGLLGLRVIDGAMYLIVDSPMGLQLWRTDGTPAGTSLVSSGLPGWGPDQVAVAGRRLFIGNGSTVWSSDGTVAGSGPLHTLTSPNRRIELVDALGGRALLRVIALNASGVLDDEAELWVSDGTAAGTQRLAVLGLIAGDAIGHSSFLGTHSVEVNGRAVFVFASRETVELWVTDGTAAGTSRLTDVLDQGRSDLPVRTPFASAGGFAWFAARDGTSGTELWRTDGTAAGTVRVADLVAGVRSSSPTNFFVEEPFVYFSAFDDQGDEELWALNVGLDNTPPVITPLLLGSQGQNGWFTSNVTVRFTVADPESPVTSMGCGDTIVSTDTSEVSFTCTASSVGGTSRASQSLKRDATPPVLTCPAAESAEATSPSGASVRLLDAVAVEALTTASSVQRAPASEVFALGSTAVRFTSSDEAGNVGQCITQVVVTDTTAPVITCPAPPSSWRRAPRPSRSRPRPSTWSMARHASPSRRPAAACSRPV